MGILKNVIKTSKTVVILGHVNPDGDCIGSCLGMYNYIRENFPKVDVSVYLEPMGVKFSYLKGYAEVRHEFDPEKTFDLCLTLDASDEGRLGAFAPYLRTAKYSLCIDHHITNHGLAKANVIEPEASSACEVLYSLLKKSRISKDVAECLYTGIAHDTGVFKYSNVSKKTLRIAGNLIDMGIDFPQIIDRSFFMKSYGQAKLHGRAILDSQPLLDGKLLYTVVTQAELAEYGCTVKATDGIAEQMRVVDGVECSVLLYETGNPSEYKISMRTNSDLDVSRIAVSFGGGGHTKAAGATVTGEVKEIVGNICEQVMRQWEELENQRQ